MLLCKEEQDPGFTFFFFLTQKMRGTAEPWYRQPPKRGGTAAEKFQAFLKFWAGNRRAEAAGGG
jgi:hypothetical protein